MSWIDELELALTLPRARQPEAFAKIRGSLPTPEHSEIWNTAFAPGSLFDAWTSSSLMRAVYAANAAVLRPLLTPGFRAIEIGGGDGRLWQQFPELRGELVLVDPAEQAHEAVRSNLPAGLAASSQICGVEEAALDEADVVVCSLTLHHLAGRDAAERRQHGLSGPGKLEVLREFRRCLPSGTLLLNEADVHCDLALVSGSDALLEHMIDSYLRRAARSLLADRRAATDPDLRARLAAVVRHFCLEQLDLAQVSVADRDVYELDVAHWLELLDAAGFSDVEHRYTDDAHLFVQYVAR